MKSDEQHLPDHGVEAGVWLTRLRRLCKCDDRGQEQSRKGGVCYERVFQNKRASQDKGMDSVYESMPMGKRRTIDRLPIHACDYDGLLTPVPAIDKKLHNTALNH
jgi:hypothetical protein